ncbi:MAG: ATP-binding protein [Colwellia sp.]|nr:ATP-binding protein [Colwellia sp.]MCW8866083.1 ATP-binding protein [Colwellia sp.]MCW9083100.1 ATP-binding protein [Colwellia sp.]
MNKAVEINDKLTKRLLLYILLCSVFGSVCSTIVQLYASFQDDLALLDQRFDNIEKSYIPSIASSLWDFNKPLVAQQIQGIVDLPDIGLVKIENDFDYQHQIGDDNIDVKKVVEFPIEYQGKNVGKLKVYADYQDIYQQLWLHAGFILTSEFIKIFIVAFFIIIIVDKLITRHLFQITRYAQQLASHNLDEELTLSNRPATEDELDYLVNAINSMRIKLKNEIVKLEDAENALLALNGELEVKVHDRTAKLEESNQQLQQSLDDLTLAQDQLVQSEKMASLGQLVAGVAHEVNTPLGICVTSITALKEKVDSLKHAVDSQELTKSFLTDTLNLLGEYEQIIERSLNKSVELIRSFKSVAVEQHTDPEMNINLRQHVYDVVNTVKTMFKHKKYHIEIDIDEDFSLVTYPSAWNQILTNFLMNSHIHGFEDRRHGDISIVFTHSKGYLTLLYCDNGKGIEEEFKKRIFDPFVTTKRGQGGSGLGLNIVFNLVSAKLSGTITSLDTDQGVCFKVKVPIKLPKENSVVTLREV